MNDTLMLYNHVQDAVAFCDKMTTDETKTRTRGGVPYLVEIVTYGGDVFTYHLLKVDNDLAGFELKLRGREYYRVRYLGHESTWNNKALNIARIRLRRKQGMTHPTEGANVEYKEKVHQLNIKREAARTLGIRDEHLVAIPTDARDREALLFTIALLKSNAEAKDEGHQAHIKALESRLKSAIKAKNLANARADKAESSLRKVGNVLAGLDETFGG